ncbi:MAG: hypothetical protein ACK5V0_03600, partial [Alphaproteobacteria bacterium]
MLIGLPLRYALASSPLGRPGGLASVRARGQGEGPRHRNRGAPGAAHVADCGGTLLSHCYPCAMQPRDPQQLLKSVFGYDR